MSVAKADQKGALKLAFEPEEYLVTWDLPTGEGHTFSSHGVLVVNPDRAPAGTAHGEFHHVARQMKSGGAAFPQYVEVPRITGQLANGAHVLLLDARVSYWFLTQARIDAAAAIVTVADVTTDDPSGFQKIEVQVGGLDAIAGIAPIKKTSFPKSGAEGTWSADVVDATQTWVRSGITLSLHFDGSFRPFDGHSFGIGFSPLVRVDLGEKVSFERLIDHWVLPIRRVVSIATGRPEPLTYFAVRVPSGDRREPRGQVYGAGITQAPYEATQDEVRKVNAPLQLARDGVSLLDIVTRWQSMVADNHPLVETYGAMLHAKDQHPRSRFLLLLQAIEGAHGHETKASFARRQKKHDEARSAVIEAAAETLDVTQSRFLEKNLARRPPAGLESAINWLAKKLPGDVKKSLQETALVKATFGEPVNARNASDALRIIRNDLAHGNRGYDAFELHEVVKLLELMVRTHALQLLGCPEVVIERVFRD